MRHKITSLFLIVLIFLVALLPGSIGCSCGEKPTYGLAPSSLIPVSNNTYDLGTSAAKWRTLYLGTTANIQNLVSGNITLTGGSATGLTNVTSTSGTITTLGSTTGTIVTLGSTTATATNLLSGNVTITGGSVTGSTVSGSGVTAALLTGTITGVASGNTTLIAGYRATSVLSGLGAYPLLIFLTYASSPGNNTSILYTSNQTAAGYFDINTTDNVTSTCTVFWRAQTAVNK